MVNHTLKEIVTTNMTDIGNQLQLLKMSFNWELKHSINIEKVDNVKHVYSTYSLIM